MAEEFASPHIADESQSKSSKKPESEKDEYEHLTREELKHKKLLEDKVAPLLINIPSITSNLPLTDQEKVNILDSLKDDFFRHYMEAHRPHLLTASDDSSITSSSISEDSSADYKIEWTASHPLESQPKLCAEIQDNYSTSWSLPRDNKIKV